jgi:succinate dehydrogenase / fumarate reductase membrane anchor subunit
MTARLAATAQGVWAWVLQRVTAVLLVVFLGTHLAVLHYVDENLIITFAGVATRMKIALYVFVDCGLLIIGLYHALNGLRAVLFDFNFGAAGRRNINIVLWVVGVVFALLGLYTLTAFFK